jgi:high affinity sulfate transporter 1
MSVASGTIHRPTGRRLVFSSLAGYQPAWLRGDLIAGLTVWAVLVPESLAYATIAGVSPVVGLYAAPAALLMYAVFGSSRQLIVGPMSATAALSAAIVADYAAPGSDAFTTMTVTLAIAAGAIAVVAGLLRLGFLANFISEPVFKGFIVGLALTIIAGQLPKLFGVPGGSGEFFGKVIGLIENLSQTNLPTLAVGLVSLVIVLGLKVAAPKVPGSLIAVLLGIVCVNVLGLAAHGVEIVGKIPAGLPPLGLPAIKVSDLERLIGPAAGVVLIGFAEGFSAAKAYGARTHDRIDANRELLGLGAANLGAGFTSGMVVNGSLSKTAVNGDAGARSQVSGLVVAVLTILTLLFLTGLFESLPEATLAAVVIAAVIELVDIRSLQRLYALSSTRLGRIYGPAARLDFISAIAALLGVLIFGTLPGLLTGVVVSILLLLYRASNPHVATLGRVPGTSGRFADVGRHPGDPQIEGVLILRPESGMFFANADDIRAVVEGKVAETGAKMVILDLETVPFVDITAIRMLVALGDELHRGGTGMMIAHDLGQVGDLVKKEDIAASIDGLYPTVADAVAAIDHPAEP